MPAIDRKIMPMLLLSTEVGSEGVKEAEVVDVAPGDGWLNSSMMQSLSFASEQSGSHMESMLLSQ